MIFSIQGQCEHKPGMAVDLSRYPNLAQLPGRGAQTHLAGKLVEDIALDASSADIVTILDHAAARNGVTLDEYCDAIRYARASKLI